MSSTGTPRVSIVMAVFNGERYVGAAIESLLRQTSEDFEVLVIDDGSLDRTREIVGSYTDPRVRLVIQDRNRGLASSLNHGLHLARGEFIARQDADDESEPLRLETQVAFLEASTNVVLAGSWYRSIDHDGRLTGNHKLPETSAAIRWAMLTSPFPMIRAPGRWPPPESGPRPAPPTPGLGPCTVP
jgi:glycosyltransferase involved in cell wall biosynthesis